MVGRASSLTTDLSGPHATSQGQRCSNPSMQDFRRSRPDVSVGGWGVALSNVFCPDMARSMLYISAAGRAQASQERNKGMNGRRCVWFPMAVMLLAAAGVRADGAVPVVSPHGVRFDLPAGFAPAPAAARQVKGVSQAFSDGMELPVQVLMQPGAAIDPSHSPHSAGFSLETYAEGFAAGMRGKLKGLELTAVTPVLHDAGRSATRLRVDATGPAQVLGLLAVPDSHAAWQPLRASGADLNQVRCLIEAVLAGRPSATPDQLAANYAAAGARCGRSQAQVATFVRESGPALFAPTAIAFHAITFFTRSATLSVFVTGAGPREADAAAVADAIWAHAVVGAAAKPEVSVFGVARGTDAFRTGELLGVVLGAALRVLLLGGLLAFLLSRFAGLAPGIAVLSALAALALLVVLGAATAGRFGAATGLQLGTYAIVGALGYLPMRGWLAARVTPGGGGRRRRGAARGR